jgi:hypothetical protein
MIMTAPLESDSAASAARRETCGKAIYDLRELEDEGIFLS